MRRESADSSFGCDFAGLSGKVAAQGLIAALYFAAGVLALSIYPLGGGLAGVWPAAGISVAAVLIFGPSAVIGVFAGDFLVGLDAGLAATTALPLALGSVGEALVAWLLLVRLFPIDLRLARVRDVSAFIVLGAAPSALLCVGLRLLLLAMLGNGSTTNGATSGLFAGFVGHGLGVLVVAPVILTWYAQRGRPGASAESYVLMLAAALLNAAAFTATPEAPGSAMLYAVFLVVLWAALRFGPRETATVMLMTGIFATWAAGRSSGPFLVANQVEALFSLGLFLFVAAATALFLAAAACEKQLYFWRVEESERAHRTLIEHMAEGVLRLDDQAYLTYVSDRFCEIVRRSREQLIGRPLRDLIREVDWPATEAVLKNADPVRQLHAEVQLRRPGDAAIVVSFAPRKLTDTLGRPTGMMAIVADVTQRRQAEEAARSHLQQLAHMGRVKSMDEMAVAFAHEIAQPLTAITSYTNAAQRFVRSGGTDNPALSESLDGADREARRASTIVRRIRGFVQDRRSELADVDVETLLDEVLRIAEPEVRQSEVVVTTAITGAPGRVRVDPIQVQQVLLNLVRNAADARANGGSAQRQIWLGAFRRADGWVEFFVDDSGPGIPATDLERVFEPFYTTKEDGVGIGLALCRSIITAHGGRLWAESAAKGASFRFTLKAVDDD